MVNFVAKSITPRVCWEYVRKSALTYPLDEVSCLQTGRGLAANEPPLFMVTIAQKGWQIQTSS